MIIQESTLRNIEVPGFTCVQRLKSGVGIAIYVRPTIEFRKLVFNKELYEFNNEENFLTTGITIGNIDVISVYVHPSTSLGARKHYVSALTKYLVSKERWLILGDLNDWWDMFGNSNGNSNSAWSILMDNDNVFCLNDGRSTRPRSGKALDVTFSKGIDHIYWDLMEEERDFDSDHLETFVCLKGDDVMRHITSNQVNQFRNWAQIKKKIQRKLRHRDFNLNGADVLNWYTDILMSCCSNKKYIYSSKKTYKPWWSKELSDLKRKKNRALNNGDEILFRNLRKDFRKLVRRSKRNYFRASALEIAHSVNPFRGIYSVIPSLRKRFTKSKPVQENGPLFTANEIAGVFKNISSADEDTSNEDDNVLRQLNEMIGTTFEPITEREFMSVLENSKKRSSPGSDGLQYKAWCKLCEVSEIRTDILKALNYIWRRLKFQDYGKNH